MIQTLLAISVILLIIFIVFIIYQYNKKLKQIHKLNTEAENKILDELYNDIHTKKEELKQLEKTQLTIQDSLSNQKQLSQEAFENYCDILTKSYEEKEQEYNSSIELLNKSYDNAQNKILNDLKNAKDENYKILEEQKKEIERELAEAHEELDKIRATRAAAIQAQLKEKEIEENSSFYCLKISDNDLNDISTLETIKPKLNNKRTLSMLIWQTFFRTPMTNLCNNVIGKEVKTGIYKITNQVTKECYIGQALDLASRQKEHAKAGLGIDTPIGNKLYKSMQEYGIQNFSQEILEECQKSLLNEKEKYYIELYDSKNFGFNSTKGVG